MAFLGAFLNAGKGVFDAVKIKRDLSYVNNEIGFYNRGAAYIKSLEGEKKIIAQNNLLMAEYMIKRQKLDYKGASRLWERTKVLMDTKLQQVEEELEEQYATKLDIARILTALTQMSGEIDKELLKNKQELRRIKKRQTLIITTGLLLFSVLAIILLFH